LTVKLPITASVSGGTTLEFDIYPFLNPYSGIPRTGFFIITTDSKGGEVDSTLVAGISIAIQVTLPTSFNSISFSRVDTMQTVGEPSEVKFDFTLDLPIDAGCRIKVTFPSDMPLTSDL
jgi:hypothetical protein